MRFAELFEAALDNYDALRHKDDFDSTDPLVVAIREILFFKWNAPGRNLNEWEISEYDFYMPSIYRRAIKGKSVKKFAEYLNYVDDDSFVENNRMRNNRLCKTLNRVNAEKILALAKASRL